MSTLDDFDDDLDSWEAKAPMPAPYPSRPLMLRRRAQPALDAILPPDSEPPRLVLGDAPFDRKRRPRR